MLQGMWQFISTQLLSTPRKIYKLCNDLESHFFVMLYNTLHFMKHNKPSSIDMRLIFDQSSISRHWYPPWWHQEEEYVQQRLPCNIHQLAIHTPHSGALQTFWVSQGLSCCNDYNAAMARGYNPIPLVIEDIEKLKDCAAIKKLFGEALESNRWLMDCDKIEDQYPPIGCLTSQQKETIALSYFDCNLTTETSTGKQERGASVETHPQQCHKVNDSQ